MYGRFQRVARAAMSSSRRFTASGGWRSTTAPKRWSRSRLPVSSLCRPSQSTSPHSRPSLRAAAAVQRQWLDCIDPQVTTASAPASSASASSISSFRILFPPSARPVRSSRLTRISTPSSAERRGRGSSGVGKVPSGTLAGSFIGELQRDDVGSLEGAVLADVGFDLRRLLGRGGDQQERLVATLQLAVLHPEGVDDGNDRAALGEPRLDQRLSQVLGLVARRGGDQQQHRPSAQRALRSIPATLSTPP